MNHHVCDFTVFHGRPKQKDDGDDHSRKHRWVRLVKWVLLHEVHQNGDRNRKLHIQLDHPPPFRIMIKQQIITVLHQKYLLVLRRVNIWGFCAKILEFLRWIDFPQLDRLFRLHFLGFGEISYLSVDDLLLLFKKLNLLDARYTRWLRHSLVEFVPNPESSLQHFFLEIDQFRFNGSKNYLDVFNF